MEMQLKKEPLSYLEPVVCSGRELEQTQQIRLPEGMPDIGKVLGVWGQSVLRSKEWRADGVSISGGVLVWVLYAPEDGSQPRALDGWIGFQGKWDLPEGSPDGTVLVQPIVRTLDAQSVSPRKLLVRAGLGISCMALCRREAEYSVAGELPEDVLLRREQRPLRLYAEAGEKGFVLEDNLPLSGEGTGKIVSCTAQCLLTDRKVVGDKLAFRGSTEVHGLFLTEEGMPVSRHFTLPFSQLIQLEKAYGSDGEADISFCITNLETENDAEGQTRLKLGITAQYAISDVTNLELLTDAYSPHREVKLSWDTVDVCAILDRRWETVSADTALPEDADNALDLFGMWEEPVWDRTEEGIRLEASGSAQLLYRQGESLNAALLHWQGTCALPAREDGRLAVTAFQGTQPQLNPAAGQLTGGCAFCLTVLGGKGIHQVSAIELGELQPKQTDSPSLILCRAGEQDLWTLAKTHGSTVEAILEANQLEGEPEKEKMILIPVG